MQAKLILEDGRIFHGRAFGHTGKSVGEVVFNTAMTGYQEVLTDPSYKGQIVTMTCPHIGNTGINPDDMESEKPQAQGFIIRDYCSLPGNFRSTETLDHFLKRHHICGIHQLDTRALTRHIREKGSMNGIISSDQTSEDALKSVLTAFGSISKMNLVEKASCEKPFSWKEPLHAEFLVRKTTSKMLKKNHIVVLDFGVKHNILRSLISAGWRVTVLPASSLSEEIAEYKPDAILLSNGPGNPEALPEIVKNIQNLIKKVPVFGICLGHQLIALAAGAKTFKLRFGHHGCNHPVKNMNTGRVEITSQNHNYAVDSASLEKAGFELTHFNLYDGTAEGMKHKDMPLVSVQYHPEVSPGPRDAEYFFNEMIKHL